MVLYPRTFHLKRSLSNQTGRATILHPGQILAYKPTSYAYLAEVGDVSFGTFPDP